MANSLLPVAPIRICCLKRVVGGCPAVVLSFHEELVEPVYEVRSRPFCRRDGFGHDFYDALLIFSTVSIAILSSSSKQRANRS